MKALMKGKDKGSVGKMSEPTPSINESVASAQDFARQRKDMALAEHKNTKVSPQILALDPQPRVKALEKKIEELQWELENEQIIYNKLQEMPLANRKKAFLNELTLQKEIVENRMGALAEQIEEHRTALEEARQQTLKGEVTQKEGQLSELKSRLDAVTLQRNHLQMQLAQREEELLAELERLEGGRYTLSKHVLTLNAQIVMLKAEKTSMEAIVQAAQTELMEVKGELKRATLLSSQANDRPAIVEPKAPPKPNNEDNGLNVTVLLREKELLLTEKSRLIRERDELENALRSMATEKAEMENTLEGHTKEVEDYSKLLQDAQSQLSVATIRVKELEEDLEQKVGEMERVKGEVEQELRRTLASAEAKTKTATETAEKMSIEVAELRTKLEQASTSLIESQKTVLERDYKIKEQEEHLRSLRASMEAEGGSYSQQLDSLMAEVASLRSQAALATEQAERDRKQAARDRQELQSATEQLEEARRTLLVLERRVSEEKESREAEVDRLTLARTKQVAELELQRERELARRDREIATLKEDLESAQHLSSDSHAQLAVMEKQLERSKAESEALNEALMRTIQQKLELAAQVEQWEQDMSQIVKTSIALQS
eukprot:comp16649_c0_seq1/m.14846 comp16649_c0_seq1/g.14846  ORF comp16649_c0_seq1/g.14846 comp16649_c0_seq1/m.14846 type:complete len:607 (-) comp16649_c0_seq1:550-2370(-)